MKRIIRREARRGFTLVELLVVMAILIMLAGFVVPRIVGVMGESNVQVTTAQLQAFKGALKQYEIHMGDFPMGEQGLEALVRTPQGDDEKAGARWKGPYMDGGELPVDAWGNAFQYTYPPEKGHGPYPDIWSYGKDGEDNTEDDICSWKASGSKGEEGLDSEFDEGLLNDDMPLDVSLNDPITDKP